mmetsp:Transcript_6762/g.19160  ORF Transcript_6762/g.19160 Transcript_6762/m.19160 type:complete len:249 (+) Transcript_6762:1935-2681(+)
MVWFRALARLGSGTKVVLGSPLARYRSGLRSWLLAFVAPRCRRSQLLAAAPQRRSHAVVRGALRLVPRRLAALAHAASCQAPSAAPCTGALRGGRAAGGRADAALALRREEGRGGGLCCKTCGLAAQTAGPVCQHRGPTVARLRPDAARLVGNSRVPTGGLAFAAEGGSGRCRCRRVSRGPPRTSCVPVGPSAGGRAAARFGGGSGRCSRADFEILKLLVATGAAGACRDGHVAFLAAEPLEARQPIK